MMRHALILCALLAAAPSTAQPVAVPSGQPVEFVEVVRDARGPQGLTLRFRFVAPWISREDSRVGFAETSADMEFLCTRFALPRVASPGPRPRQIIISLSSEPLEFGDLRPEITQFFEAYGIEDDVCIWEGF